MSRPLDNGAWRKVRSASPGAVALSVVVSDLSGLSPSAWAFARAEARAPTDSLDRCMARPRVQEVEAHRAGFGALCSHPMSDRLFGVFGQQGLEFGLGSLVIEIRWTSAAKERGEFGPGIRRTHIDDANRLDTRSRRFSIDEVGDFTRLDAPPEFLFCRYQDGQVEWVHGDRDLDPLAAAGDD